MAHELPALPYAYDALEPYIDTLTMQIHHDKHHAAYVTNLNKALEAAPALQSLPVAELLASLSKVPDNIRQAVINNGGGVWNHTLYWQIMGPKAGGEPTGDLAAAIKTAFGGFDAFKAALSNAGMTRFGSGWAWLVLDKEGKLVVTSTANQDCPLSNGQKVLLGVDVWEHAYYLKYQNRRADYLAAWWNVVNWSEVAARYKQAKG
jgi:Fe-Mn family superoxide dismutase